VTMGVTQQGQCSPGGHPAELAQPWASPGAVGQAAEPTRFLLSVDFPAIALSARNSTSTCQSPRAPHPDPGQTRALHGRWSWGSGDAGIAKHPDPPESRWEPQPLDTLGFREKPNHERPEPGAEPGATGTGRGSPWDAAPGMLSGPGGTRGKSGGRSGKGRWGREPARRPATGAGSSGRKRGLAGRCRHPGHCQGTAAARKGAVSGVFFGLFIALWVFIFQTSSPHGTNESRRSSPRLSHPTQTLPPAPPPALPPLPILPPSHLPARPVSPVSPLLRPAVGARTLAWTLGRGGTCPGLVPCSQAVRPSPH